MDGEIRFDIPEGDAPEPPPPPAPSAVEQHIVATVQRMLAEGQTRMADLRSRWRVAREMESGQTNRQLRTGMSELHSPALWKAHCTLLQNQLVGLFPSHDFIDVEPDGPTAEDALAAEFHGHLLRQQLADMGFVEMMTERGLHSFNVLGTLVLRVEWDRRMGRRTIHSVSSQTLALPDGGEAVVEVPTRRAENVLLANRPTVRVVDLFSLFPSTTEADTLDELEWLIETSVIRHDDMLAERVRLTEHTDERGRLHISREGRYRNTERIRRSAAEPQPAHGADDGPAQPADGAAETGARGHRRIECWAKINMAEELRREADGGPLFSGEDVVAFLEKFDLTREDLESGGWWVIEVIADQLVRIEPNPYPFDNLPYTLVCFAKSHRQLFGRGLYDIAGGLQVALDAVVSCTVDAQMKTVAPQYGVVLQMIDESYGPPEEQLDYRPHGAVVFHPGADISRFLQPIAPNPMTVQMGIEAERQIMDRIRDFTGAKAELQGLAGKSSRATATEISTNEANAAAFVSMQNSRVERTLIEPVCDQIIEMNRAFMRDDQTIMVPSERGAPNPLTIRWQWLQGRVRSRARGSGELTNRLMRGRALLDAFAVLGPVMWPDEVARVVLKTWRVPGDIGRLVKSREEMMALAQAEGPETQTEIPTSPGPRLTIAEQPPDEAALAAGTV